MSCALSLVDGAGSYSVAHRAGLLPTQLTGMWGWILLRYPHQGRRSPPAPAPAKQRHGAGGSSSLQTFVVSASLLLLLLAAAKIRCSPWSLRRIVKPPLRNPAPKPGRNPGESRASPGLSPG